MSLMQRLVTGRGSCAPLMPSVRLHLLVRFDNRTSPPFRGSSYRHKEVTSHVSEKQDLFVGLPVRDTRL
jgi:hypothetical protein